QLWFSRHKHLQGKFYSHGNRYISGNVAPAQRKILDNPFTGNHVATILHRGECLEPLSFPKYKPGHTDSLSLPPDDCDLFVRPLMSHNSPKHTAFLCVTARWLGRLYYLNKIYQQLIPSAL